MNIKDELLTLTPIEEYQAPSLPTYEDAKPDLKKIVPSRWKNKVMVAATSLALLTPLPLSGCQCFHLGGAGPAPIYVVHLTEQEALVMIRNQLEAVGLNFSDEVPLYSVEDWYLGAVGVDLFDEDHNVAVTFVNGHGDGTSSLSHDDCNSGCANWIREGLSEQNEAITFGVFYNPSARRERRECGRGNPHTEEELAYLTDRLETQIAAFISQLRKEGIIE